MFLKYYLAMTGAFLATDIIVSKAIVSKIDRKEKEMGYENTNANNAKNTKTGLPLEEKTSNFLVLLALAGVPIVRVGVSLVLLVLYVALSDKLMENEIEKLAASGKLVKIDKNKSQEELIAEIHETRNKLEELKAALSKYNTGEYVFDGETPEKDSLATDEHARTL